jgi:hypothetical protein
LLGYTTRKCDRGARDHLANASMALGTSKPPQGQCDAPLSSYYRPAPVYRGSRRYFTQQTEPTSGDSLTHPLVAMCLGPTQPAYCRTATTSIRGTPSLGTLQYWCGLDPLPTRSFTCTSLFAASTSAPSTVSAGKKTPGCWQNCPSNSLTGSYSSRSPRVRLLP